MYKSHVFKELDWYTSIFNNKKNPEVVNDVWSINSIKPSLLNWVVSPRKLQLESKNWWFGSMFLLFLSGVFSGEPAVRFRGVYRWLSGYTLDSKKYMTKSPQLSRRLFWRTFFLWSCWKVFVEQWVLLQRLFTVLVHNGFLRPSGYFS